MRPDPKAEGMRRRDECEAVKLAPVPPRFSWRVSLSTHAVGRALGERRRSETSPPTVPTAWRERHDGERHGTGHESRMGAVMMVSRPVPSLHSSLRLSVGSGVTSPTPTARVRRVERGVWWEDGDTGPFTVTPGLFLSSSQLCSRQDSIYLRTFTVIISVSLPEDHETGFQLPGWPLDRKDYNYIYFFTLGRLNSY